MKRRELMKRALAGALTASMLLSTGSTAFAAPEDYDALEDAVKANDDIIRDGKVRVSIILTQASTLGRGYSTQDIANNDSAMSYRQQVLSNQQAVESRISNKVLGGQELEVVWNITLAGNMISAWVPVESLSELTEVRGVEDVIIETRYEAPKTDSVDTAQPNMTVSGDMTDSVNVWASGSDGFTGAGTQVAIIDTGFDFDHQSFANDSFLYSIQEIKDAGREVTLMNLADVENVWSQLNASKIDSTISYTADQVYRNEKVPFGFNYVDNSLEITHDNDDQGDHGSHVSGIAAANRYIRNEEGEYVSALDTVLTQGQAPDAQVVVMKVFGEEGGAYDSDYMVAIEDAVMLGCESINLSLGSTQPGFYTDVTSSKNRYNGIFEALASSDAVVNIAAGNSYNWADNASTGGVIYSDDVNFDMVGKPGSYRNALSVASVNNDGMTGHYVTAYDKNIFYNETRHSNEPLITLAGDEAYDYIYIDGTATSDEVTALGDILKDKIVICRRGDITFVEKAENLANAGAAAVFIANNTAGVIALDLSDYTHTQPVAALTQEDGNFLRDQGTKNSEGDVTYYEGSLVISDAIGNFNYDSDYYAMSDFSSWGIPSSLKMKPEITAPGGNIYSVNGKDTSAAAYRNGSGTSMATPQITGISAVLAQYAWERGLDTFAKENNLTLRALEQALMMGTAQPVKEEASDNYYPIIRQGAGLVNLEAATRANTLIIMADSATDSAADGKVKAEIGDDPDRTGSFQVPFTVYNTSEETQTLELSGDFFTQQYAEDSGITYMIGQTTSIPSDITWTVNGTVVTNEPVDDDVDSKYDFNGDGIYNREDARTVLFYAVGNTDAITSNASNADLDSDGDIDTYDAYLALNQSSTVSGSEIVIPAGESIRVNAQVQISMPAELDDKGNYVEGYLFVKELSTNEGEAGVEQSIPVLGYYGSWTEPSMYDRGSKIDSIYNTETKAPYAAEVGTPSNSITYYNESGAVTYDALTFGLNPYIQDETYHPERAAINKESRISNVNYSLIRNSAKTRFIVEDENGTEYFSQVPTGSEYAAYYNSNSSESVKWENIPSEMYLNKNSDKTKNFTTSTLSKVPEGTMLRFALESAPEYYAGEDGSIDWNSLGDGAKIEVKAVMDTTAPEFISAEGIRDDSGNLTGIRAVVKDANYIAGVQLLQGSFMNLEKQGAPEEQTRGGEAEFIFTGVKDGVTEYSIAIYDYAGNKSTTKIPEAQLGFEEKQVNESPEKSEAATAEENSDTVMEDSEEISAGDTGADSAETSAEESITAVENSSVDSSEDTEADSVNEFRIPTGSLSETRSEDQDAADAEEKTGNSIVKEYSENGDTITITLLSEKALTNGKYDISFNADEVEVVEVKGVNADTAFKAESGRVTFGFINDIAYAEGTEVGQIILKAVSGDGTVIVSTVEENNTAGDSTASYEYKNGFFKPEEEEPHEHSFGEWKAESDYSGIYRTCTVCDERETFANNFTDVKGGSYFIPILWAAKNNVTSGTKPGIFDQKAACTRAQVVTFLWNAAGKPEPETKENPFVDVKESSSYYKAILWAYENDITSGTDKSHFSPSVQCNRSQIVTFLWKYAGSPDASAVSSPYKDVKETDYFFQAVLWAAENGITSGLSKDTFGSKQVCTRAQTVTFLYHYSMLD